MHSLYLHSPSSTRGNYSFSKFKKSYPEENGDMHLSGLKFKVKKDVN